MKKALVVILLILAVGFIAMKIGKNSMLNQYSSSLVEIEELQTKVNELTNKQTLLLSKIDSLTSIKQEVKVITKTIKVKSNEKIIPISNSSSLYYTRILSNKYKSKQR